MLRYVGQLKAPAMVQMRAPRRGGVTGRTQMATMALALAMALAVDDLADHDGPLARVLRASENREANDLLGEGREEMVCFDQAKTVCLCRLPANAAQAICGGEPCWALDRSVMSTRLKVPYYAPSVSSQVWTPVKVDMHHKDAPNLAHASLHAALPHGSARAWACARGHTERE